jgi:alginate O-acetyltransferase complex protein AlgJ
MKPSFPEKCGRVQAGVLAVLSMIMIWLPTFDSFLHLDKAPVTNENRAMAGFPEFQSGSEGLREYITGLDLYFNDHFGFRKRLIRWQHRWKHQLFNESKGKDVIIGRDGWLFYSGEDMIENVQGINPFTPDQLKAWQSLLESRRDWCVRHGSAYIFVIPPDKHSIYPEYLPDWLLPVKKPDKLDQFMAYMKTNSTVPILDLRPALLAAKTNGILYFSTDSHWNYLGAFAGCQSLVRTLSGQLPGLKPLPPDTFEWQFAPQAGKDLARMLGLEQSMTEKANVLFSLRPPLKPLSVTIDTNLLIKIRTKETAPMVTENPDGKGKAILFQDSFGRYCVPYLGYHFNKVFYIWQYDWDMAFLEQQKPDVVIDEMVERYLDSIDPASLKEIK